MAEDLTPHQGQAETLTTPSVVLGGITTETMPRHMTFAQVTTDELEDLKSSNGTLELAFFGVCFGALVSVATTLRTVTLTDPATKATFVGSAIVFAIGTAFFGIGAARGQWRWRKKIDELKKSIRRS